MLIRLMLQDKVLYEGEAVPIPRAGDGIERDGESLPVESVTWQFNGNQAVVTLAVGERPYTY